MNATNRTELPGPKATARAPGGEPGHPAVAAPSAAPSRTVLNVRVDRLTLEGFSRADAGRVESAMRRKIAELAGTTAALSRASPVRIARIDAGTVAAGSSPERIGEHLAIRIFKGLMG